MNAMIFAFLCMGAVVSANYISNDDGQWKGEGLAESQDNGQYNLGYNAYNGAYNYAGAYSGAYAHGAAPIGIDGRVVDTPEVAHAKAAHFSAKAAASNGAVLGAYSPLSYVASPAVYGSYASPAVYGAYAHGLAPLAQDGVVVDTPEVAHAKIAHKSAVARLSSGVAAPAVYGAYASPAVYGAYASPAVYGAYASPAVYGAYAHGLAPLAQDGVVVDTPEVAHAKIAHKSAVARLSSGVAASAVYGAYASPAVYGAYASPAVYGAYASPAIYGSYAHGAAPIGIDGRVVDTPEVAHAKAAHFAAKAAASHY